MTRAAVAAIVVLLMTPGESTGHRLDEYLQAARVSLDRDRITLEVDLTPGASIAPAIIAMLDRDGDNTISPGEAATYGRVVLRDLIVELDDHAIATTLARVEVPSIDEMRGGVGTIQLRATGTVAGDGIFGRRHLYFRNNHQPGASAYLVNALVPDVRDVGVMRQTRDPRQQEIRVEYNVGAPWYAQLAWVMLAVLGLSVWIVGRTARKTPPQRTQSAQT